MSFKLKAIEHQTISNLVILSSTYLCGLGKRKSTIWLIELVSVEVS